MRKASSPTVSAVEKEEIGKDQSLLLLKNKQKWKRVQGVSEDGESKRAPVVCENISLICMSCISFIYIHSYWIPILAALLLLLCFDVSLVYVPSPLCPTAVRK